MHATNTASLPYSKDGKIYSHMIVVKGRAPSSHFPSEYTLSELAQKLNKAYAMYPLSPYLHGGERNYYVVTKPCASKPPRVVFI